MPRGVNGEINEVDAEGAVPVALAARVGSLGVMGTAMALGALLVVGKRPMRRTALRIGMLGSSGTKLACMMSNGSEMGNFQQAPASVQRKAKR